MNLISIRDRAAERQAAAHQSRSFHRERQKECEREDQTMKKVVRSINDLIAAQAGFAAILSDLTPEQSIVIGAVEEEPCAHCAPVEDPAWLTGDVAASEPVASETASPPLSKLDAAFTALIAEATNGYASISIENFAKSLGVSMITARKRLDALVADGRIGTVKSRFPEPGWATFRILDKKAAAE